MYNVTTLCTSDSGMSSHVDANNTLSHTTPTVVDNKGVQNMCYESTDQII